MEPLPGLAASLGMFKPKQQWQMPAVAAELMARGIDAKAPLMSKEELEEEPAQAPEHAPAVRPELDATQRAMLALATKRLEVMDELGVISREANVVRTMTMLHADALRLQEGKMGATSRMDERSAAANTRATEPAAHRGRASLAAMLDAVLQTDGQAATLPLSAASLTPRPTTAGAAAGAPPPNEGSISSRPPSSRPNSSRPGSSRPNSSRLNSSRLNSSRPASSHPNSSRPTPRPHSLRTPITPGAQSIGAHSTGAASQHSRGRSAAPHAPIAPSPVVLDLPPPPQLQSSPRTQPPQQPPAPPQPPPPPPHASAEPARPRAFIRRTPSPHPPAPPSNATGRSHEPPARAAERARSAPASRALRPVASSPSPPAEGNAAAAGEAGGAQADGGLEPPQQRRFFPKLGGKRLEELIRLQLVPSCLELQPTVPPPPLIPCLPLRTDPGALEPDPALLAAVKAALEREVADLCAELAAALPPDPPLPLTLGVEHVSLLTPPLPTDAQLQAAAIFELPPDPVLHHEAAGGVVAVGGAAGGEAEGAAEGAAREDEAHEADSPSRKKKRKSAAAKKLKGAADLLKATGRMHADGSDSGGADGRPPSPEHDYLDVEGEKEVEAEAEPADAGATPASDIKAELERAAEEAEDGRSGGGGWEDVEGIEGAADMARSPARLRRDPSDGEDAESGPDPHPETNADAGTDADAG